MQLEDPFSFIIEFSVSFLKKDNPILVLDNTANDWMGKACEI